MLWIEEFVGTVSEFGEALLFVDDKPVPLYMLQELTALVKESLPTSEERPANRAPTP